MRPLHVVLGSVLAVLPAAAYAASTSSLTLEEVLETVQRDNPEILAARRRWEASKLRAGQEGTPEGPRLDLERMYVPSGAGLFGSQGERNWALTQGLPFPGKLALRRSRARTEAELAEQAFRAKERDVLSRAEEAYAQWFLAARTADLYNENVEIMRRFSKVAEARYAAGHSGQLDALKAQTELTRMLNMRVAVEQERRAEEAAINALLGRQARSPLSPPSDPDPGELGLTQERLEAEAAEARPELRRAALEAAEAQTELALAKSEFLPDLMLQYRRRSSSTMGGSNDAVLGFTLPLWFWKPAAQVREARARREASEAEHRAAQAGTSAELAAAWLKAETARRLAQAYRTTLLPQAQASLGVAETGYQSGDNSFLDLLDAQRSLLGFRLEYYQQLADYERRLAELERIVGRGLRAP